MTALQHRPAATASAGSVPRPAWLSGLLAGLGAAVAGLLACAGLSTLAWMTGPGGSFGGALHTGVVAFLVGHGSGLDVGDVTVTAVPLGLPLVAVLVLAALSRRLTAGSALAERARLTAFVAAGAGTYAAIVVLAAIALTGGDAQVGPVRATLGGLVVGLLGMLGGAAGAPAFTQWWSGLSPDRTGVVSGAVAGVVVLLGTGLAVVAAMLVADLGTARALWTSLHPGVSGGIGLVVLSLAALPNAVCWAVATMLGPGFAVGAGTSVTLAAADLGPLPAFPLLAALPEPGALPRWAAALAVVPVLAGAVGGYRAVRRAGGDGWLDAVRLGAAAGALAGPVVAIVLLASGGAVGPGRMSDFGVPLICAVVAVAVLAAGGALGGLVAHYRGAGAHDRPVRG